MKIKILTLMALFVVASVGLMGAVGSARAADKWFVLSEQTIKSADPSVTIKSAGGRWEKDVKEVKLSVEGADVEITKAVLHWDNRRDDTISRCRSPEVGRTNGCEGRSGTQRAPHGGDGPIQDP